jgi:mannosyltransferase
LTFFVAELLKEMSHEASVASPRPKQRASTGGYWLVAVLALTGFYLVTSLYISSHRLLWADEVATVFVARLPGWTTVWKACTQGADRLPPFYFMVARVCDHLFGHNEMALRLPSALAMTAGLLITFDCACRLSDGLHGLIAVAVLTCSFLPYYGHEARSYALYFMFAALAFWIWIYDQRDTWLGAMCFGITFFLAVAMHYYALLCLVPYAAWELWNWKPMHLPSRKMMAALVAVACAAVVMWSPIQAGRRLFPHSYWSRPSLDLLRTTFSDLFPDAMFVLALVAIWIAWSDGKDKVTSVPAMQPAERVGWFFLLIPFAGFLLAEVTRAYQLRYFIGALPGIAVASSCWLWRQFHVSWRVPAGVLLLLVSFGILRQAVAVRDPNRFYYSPIRQMTRAEPILQKDGRQYFLVANQARYLEALYYSKRPQQYALLPSLDPGDVHMTLTLGQYYPMHFWTLEELKQHAGETALLAPRPSDLEMLKQAGFTLEMHGPDSLPVIYLK